LLPHSFDACLGIASALQQIGKMSEAAKRAEQAAAINPASLKAMEILAASLYELGETVEGVACLDKILDRDPARETAFALLFLFEMETYDFDMPKIGDVCDVVLINPPHWLVGAPNCGLGYVGEGLRAKGIPFALLDLSHMIYENLSARDRSIFRFELFRILSKKLMPVVKSAASWVAESGASVAGLSVSYTSRRFTSVLSGAIKAEKPDIAIVLGGYDFLWPELGEKLCAKYFDNADACIIGEGTGSFPELVLAYTASRDINSCRVPGVYLPGIGYTAGEKQPINNKFFPLYHELDINKYQDESGRKTICIRASMGCPWGKCKFCSVEVGGFCERSPRSVYEEVRYHYTNNGVDNFIFSDMHAGGRAENLLMLAELIANDPDLHVSLAGQLRFSPIMSKVSSCKLLKDAGFSYVQFGLESASPRVLKRINKGINIKLASSCLKACCEAGIIPGLFLMTGFPGESEEDHAATLAFVREMAPYIVQLESVSSFLIMYGSVYWREFVHKGIICDEVTHEVMLEDWSECDNDLTLRLKRRREILDLAYGMGIQAGFFASDGATTALASFFFERGEQKRADKILRILAASGSKKLMFDVGNIYINHGMPHDGLSVLKKCQELFGYEPDITCVMAETYYKMGMSPKFLMVLREQQRRAPCFRADLHALAQKAYGNTLEYFKSPIFNIMKLEFERISGDFFAKELKFCKTCLVLGSSFRYHILLFMCCVKSENMSLLAHEAETGLLKGLFPDVSVTGFTEHGISTALLKENNFIKQHVQAGILWDCVIILQNGSPAETYEAVFEFCSFLKPKKLITHRWDGLTGKCIF